MRQEVVVKAAVARDEDIMQGFEGIEKSVLKKKRRVKEVLAARRKRGCGVGARKEEHLVW